MLRRVASKGLCSPASRTLIVRKGGSPIPMYTRLFTSGNVFSSDANNNAKNNSASAKITKSILSKYYGQDDSRSNVIARSLSADVIASMMQEVTNAPNKIDFKTADMLVEQAILCGGPSTEAVESLISFYLTTNNVSAAATTLLHCVSHKLGISEPTCQTVIAKLADSCNWDHAFMLVKHMGEQGYHMSPEVVLFSTAGVMNSSAGVLQVLELVRLIVTMERTDLAGMLDIAKMASLTCSMHDCSLGSHPLPAQPLQEAFTASLAQLRERGWHSSNVAQLLVGLACAAGHDVMAADYVREVTQTTFARAQASSAPEESTTIDQLELLRGFTYADGLDLGPQGDPSSHSHRGRGQCRESERCSAVTLALLELCWAQPFATQVMQLGSLRCMDFFNMYWSLAYRARDVQQNSADISDTAAVAVGDAALRRHYEQLVAFVHNTEVAKQDFSPQPGYERRAFRLLCDALGLEHRLRPLPGFDGDYTVRVTRHSDPFNLRPRPPSLHAILQQDATLSAAHRQFDGLPMHWQCAVTALESCEDHQKVALLVQRLLQAMKNYPSCSWGLLFTEQLIKREVSLPPGALHNLLKHCEARDDLYGLLEVLHLAYAESLHRGTEQSRSTMEAARHSSKYASKVPAACDNGDTEEEQRGDSAQHSAERGQGEDSLGCGGLSSADWARACGLVLRPRPSTVPPFSGAGCYSELMSAMYKSDRLQDPAVVPALLTFLVRTGQDSGLLDRLLRRLYNDKLQAVAHTECNVLSAILQRGLSPDRRVLQLNRDTSVNNYITAYPYTINRMSDVVYSAALEGKLGMRFQRDFQQCWPQVHSAEGRRDLYKLVAGIFQENAGLWESLASPEETRAREALTLLSIYTAYLTAVHDGQPRRAFDLLYETLQLQKAAAAAQAEGQREKRASTRVGAEKRKMGSKTKRERDARAG